MSRLRHLTKRAAFTLIPAVALLLLGEMGVRALLFVRYGYDPKWLIAPWGWERGDRSLGEASRQNEGDRRPDSVNEGDRRPDSVKVFLGPAEGVGNVKFDYRDACKNRIISFRFNRLGYRGADWAAKPAGNTVRILALGGSSTLGVANPEEKTWPRLLENELRKRWNSGPRTEVLNAGRNAEKLEGMIQALRETLAPLEPRVVIYYGGYNEMAVNSLLFTNINEAIDYLNKQVLPALYVTLYSRSMLYTVLLEKYAIWRVTRSASALVPDVDSYLQKVKVLAKEVRRMGAKLVIVLQENRIPRGGELRDMDLGDAGEIRRYVSKPGDTGFSPIRRIAVWQHHILMEALGRMKFGPGDEAVKILDPAPAFAKHPDREKLFCDPIHLTDEGNAVLAELIAENLAAGAFSPKPAR